MNHEKTLTLGSLFDGSGGFPLGGMISGIVPVWSSEIEPFPVRVTTKRFPEMKHYGDISVLNGAELPPVNIITFGSPCQDMSIAGKRSGLGGSRSSLFYEAIIIIKEMRCATNGEYPRWIVWENVPGAFSSNKGEDFRCVLEEICKVKDPAFSVPSCDRWVNAGEIVEEGFSVAWRLFDAQFWGVPQRRKRIYLVADFAEGCAGKVLFESEGLSGYTPEGFCSWQRTATGSENSAGTAGRADAGRMILNDQGGQRIDITKDVTCTLRAEAHHPPVIMDGDSSAVGGFCAESGAQTRSIGYETEKSPTLRAGTVPAAVALENHPTDSRIKLSDGNTVQTLTERMGTGGGNVPLVMNEIIPAQTLKIRSGCEGGGKGALCQIEKSATLGCNNDQTVFIPYVKGARPHCAGEVPAWKNAEVANTLNTFDVGEVRCNELVVKAYGICSKDSNAMMSDNPHSGFYEARSARTLDANGGNPNCNQGGIAVVAVSQKQRPFSLDAEARGDGINVDMPRTSNVAERHGVAYCMTTGEFTQVIEEQSPTLAARDYKDPHVVNELSYGFDPQMKTEGTGFRAEVASTLINGTNPGRHNGVLQVGKEEPRYIVRRLTPTECARLQGFPDWWCSGLGSEASMDEELKWWEGVFETHRKLMGTSKKPKTTRQIAKWLADPHSDSAEYKMWGNGVALPNVVFVLSGIVWADKYEKRETDYTASP